MALQSGFLEGFGGTPLGQRGLFSNLLAKQPKRVRNVFEFRFNELYNEYLGGLFTDPKQTFSGFLGGLNLPVRFGALSPQQRGVRARTLQPPTRSFNF